MDCKGMKIIFANVCCFVLFTIVIYHGHQYPVLYSDVINNNDVSLEVEIDENIKEVSDSNSFHPWESNIYKNNELFLQEYQRKLCELDRPNIQKLLAYNVTVKRTFNTKRIENYVNNFFHKFVQNPHRSFCKEMKRFGGQYNINCKFTDGSKFVCMDDILRDIQNKECLIYSLGVADDWSFEDTMDDLGCTVYAFDGSVDAPKRRGENIHFEKVWVEYKNIEAENIISLPSLIAKNGHTNTKISFLKMDIEGNELKGLPHWLHDGALTNVQQIAMEFHLNSDIVITNTFIKTLRYLYLKGNYRLISYEANGCAKNEENSVPRNPYYTLAEIVLKKVTSDVDCI